MSALKLTLFGSPQVKCNGVRVELETRKALALLAYLVITHQPHSRETLTSILWPELPADRALANLRDTLYLLKKHLTDHWIDIHRQEVQVRDDPSLWVDVLEFESAVAQIIIHDHPSNTLCETCYAALLSAIDLYHDDFLRGFTLPDCPAFDEWYSFQTDLLREHLAMCFQRIVTYTIGQHDLPHAIGYAQRWIARCPWSEAAYRELMRVYALDHQRSAALQQYQACVKMLREEFGAEPGQETRALYEAILKENLTPSQNLTPRPLSYQERGEYAPPLLVGEGAGGEVLPPSPFRRGGGGEVLTGGEVPPNNLPAQTTSFIGREAETAAVVNLLSRPDVRLLTLTGAGGSGKTRLSLQVAARVLADYAEGVFFVSLAPISNPDLVVPTVVKILGLQVAGNIPPLEMLKVYLQSKHLLLVLDNFEQILAAAPVLTDLLAAAPHVTIMVTSRTVLHVSGEHEYLVPPLNLPDPTHLPSLDRLAQSEAVQLFADRARAVHAGFTLNVENAPVVAEICTRLDGLPLAIELAAARIRILPPEKMLTRLGKPLDVLTGGARDLPARQQTLRNTIEWSHHLLDPAEQTLFRRLAVFAGGWTLEAAEAVCVVAQDVDVLNGMQTLVDHNLVREYAAKGEPRLTMLETLREYAIERLTESGEAETIRQQHAQFFLELVKAAEPQMYLAERLARLELNHHNLRGALAWSLDNAVEIGLQLAAVLGEFWIDRAYYAEGREWLTKALTHSQVCVPELDTYRAKILGHAGIVAVFQGDYTSAYRLLQESQALCQALNDDAGLAQVFCWMGCCALYAARDLPGSRVLLEKSLALCRRIDDTRQLVQTLHYYGELLYHLDDDEQAGSSARELLALAQRIKDHVSIVEATNLLGRVALDQEDYEMARAFFEHSLELSQRIAYKTGIGFALAHLGTVFYAQEQYETSATYYAQAIEIFQEMNVEWVRAHSKWLGFVLLHQQRWHEASTYFANSLALCQEHENFRGIAAPLTGLAGVAEGQGRMERAAQLLGTTEITPLSADWYYKVFKHDYERIYASVRNALGSEAFESAFATGRALTLEQAIALALKDQPEGSRYARPCLKNDDIPRGTLSKMS